MFQVLSVSLNLGNGKEAGVPATAYVCVGYLLVPLESKVGNFLSSYVILYDYINGLSLIGLETVVQTLFPVDSYSVLF